MWKDKIIYKLKDDILTQYQKLFIQNTNSQSLIDLIQSSTSNDSTPQKKTEHSDQSNSQGPINENQNPLISAALNQQALLLNDHNWERIFIIADKYSGTLRYTINKEDSENGKYRYQFRGLSQIQINQKKVGDHYVATLISEQMHKNKEVLKEVISKIKCEDQTCLQVIQNALEEAKNDNKEIGRPLTLRIHDGQYNSLLSDAFDNKSMKQVELSGVVNLLVLLLLITNIKNILISLNQNGFTLSQVVYQFIQSKVYEIPENYQTIAGVFSLVIFTAISFWIEILASYKFNNNLIFILICANLITLLVYPLIFSFRIQADPILGSILMMYSVTTFLKLFSFHHVMHDVRYLVLRVIKARKDGESLNPSQVENTILGVNQSTYDEAITYPKCLKVKEFLRFMLAPTFCYQIIFPLNKQVNYKNTFKYLFQFLFSVLAVVYLTYQHIIPVGKDSFKHFENEDYYNIFLSTLNISIPASYLWLLFFFGLFHAFTNFWAEVTRFSDRRFYSDWWNAGSLAEYWRKWNSPIHNWLVRHLYYPMIRRGMNSGTARFITFLFSAAFHEYIVIGSFRIFNMLAFSFMIVNVPIMYFQNSLKNVLSNKYNNVMFWLFYTVLGQPFAILFCYYQALKSNKADI